MVDAPQTARQLVMAYGSNATACQILKIASFRGGARAYVKSRAAES